MKKLLLSCFALAVLLGFVAPAVTVSAVDVLDPVCNTNPAGKSAVCNDDQSREDNPIFGPHGIMTTIMQWMARIVGIGAVIAIMIAGFMMVASNGDSGSQTTARNALMYAVIGLVVAATAQLLVSFVLRKL
jgi:hypothetical protein